MEAWPLGGQGGCARRAPPLCALRNRKRGVATGKKMGNGQGIVDPPAAKTSVEFVLNGHKVVVEGVSPLLSLNDWLRAQPGLGGTKRMCAEGGCGCCIVSVTTNSILQVKPTSWECEVVGEQESTIAINSVWRTLN